jgi:hypothetical protein
MNTIAQTDSVAAAPAAMRHEQLASPTPEAQPTFAFTPQRIASLRATFESAALLPDEELHVFLEKFREHLLHENIPWMGEVIGSEIREIGHTRYRIGWRKGLALGIPIGSMVALLAVAAGVHWAAA